MPVYTSVSHMFRCISLQTHAYIYVSKPCVSLFQVTNFLLSFFHLMLDLHIPSELPFFFKNCIFRFLSFIENFLHAIIFITSTLHSFHSRFSPLPPTTFPCHLHMFSLLTQSPFSAVCMCMGVVLFTGAWVVFLVLYS